MWRRAKGLFWAVGAQGFSSISNLLGSIVVARSVSTAEFGGFGLAFAFYQIMLGVSRATVGEPSLVRSSLERTRGHVRDRMLSTNLAVGLAGLCVCAVLAMLSAEGARPAYLVMAASLPGLMAYDSLRYAAFATGRPHSAAAMDLSWLTLQILGSVSVALLPSRGLIASMFVWSAPPTLVAAALAVRSSLRPSVRRLSEWWLEMRDFIPRYLAEYLLLAATQQSVIYAVLFGGGVRAVGSVRSAQVIVGPANILTTGLSAVALPFLSRTARSNLRALPKYAIGIALGLSVLLAIFSVSLMFVPDAVGAAVLGVNWSEGSHLAPALGLALAVNGFAYGATSALKAMQMARQTLRLRLFLAPVAIVCVVLGSVLMGALGAVLGLLVGSALQAIAWWGLMIFLWRRLVESEGRG